MAFSEFLVAIGEEALWDLVQSGDSKLLTAFGAKTRELLKTYLLVGGMPAAVETYVRTLSFGPLWRSSPLPGRRVIRPPRLTSLLNPPAASCRLKPRPSEIFRRSPSACTARSSRRRSPSGPHLRTRTKLTVYGIFRFGLLVRTAIVWFCRIRSQRGHLNPWHCRPLGLEIIVAIAKPCGNGRAGVPPPAADGGGTPSLPGFAIASVELMISSHETKGAWKYDKTGVQRKPVTRPR